MLTFCANFRARRQFGADTNLPCTSKDTLVPKSTHFVRNFDAKRRKNTILEPLSASFLLTFRKSNKFDNSEKQLLNQSISCYYEKITTILQRIRDFISPRLPSTTMAGIPLGGPPLVPDDGRVPRGRLLAGSAGHIVIRQNGTAGVRGNPFDDNSSNMTTDHFMELTDTAKLAYMKTAGEYEGDKIEISGIKIDETQTESTSETIQTLQTYANSRGALDQLKKHICFFNLTHTFNLITRFANVATGQPPADDNLQLQNLLDPAYFATHTAASIRSSNKSFANFIYNPMIERTRLASQAVILEACSSSLKQELVDALSVVPIDEQGGAIAWYILMNKICPPNVDLNMAIWKRLGSVVIAQIEGQNLRVFTALTRTILHRLAADGYTPTNEEILFTLKQVLKTCTVPRFGAWLMTKVDNEAVILNQWGALLTAVDQVYERFTANGEWLRVKGGMHHTPGTTKPRQEDLKPGDIDVASELKKLELEALKLKKQELLVQKKELAAREKNIGQASGANTGEGPTPSGATLGRGGAGTETRGQKDAQGRWKYSYGGKLIDYEPPKEGEDHHRSDTDGNTEFWCKMCKRWGNHGTDGHAEFVKRRDARKQAKAQANGGTGSSFYSAAGSSHVASSSHDTGNEGECPFGGASL